MDVKILRYCAMVALAALIPMSSVATTTPPPTIAVPAGWTTSVIATGLVPKAVTFDADGSLLVGAVGKILRFPRDRRHRHSDVVTGSVVATTNFSTWTIVRGRDGTLYLAADSWTPAQLCEIYAIAPGTSDPYVVTRGWGYWLGLVQLDDGDLLAANPGWIGVTRFDGRVIRIPPDARDTEMDSLPKELTDQLKNPVSIEYGPDGYLYMLDQGRRKDPTDLGRLLRWRPGETTATVILQGLNDPNDFAWAPDGSLFVTDSDYTRTPSGTVIRWDPATGTVESWGVGFSAPNGIAIAENGDIFLADPGAGNVYRLCPGDSVRQRRDHRDRGHGNNADHDDEENPGRGRGGHGADPSHDDDGIDDDER